MNLQRPGRRLLQLFPSLKGSLDSQAKDLRLSSAELPESLCRRVTTQTKQGEAATSAGSSEASTSQTGPSVPPQRPPRLSDVPPTARLLGLAGVLPFIALSPPVAGILPFIPADLVANAGLLQLGYGASIASFLGGIHWSLAMVHYPGTKAAFDAASDRYIWKLDEK
ncbi:hypothetical protein WJX73_010149 [Symbiochloris irregularis]|uniref:Uncharacterized protein n=1 Tax=Symbiochloris irregularis TaxID=706552 RepID=A0AAW1NTL6_9CHLO